MDPNTAEPPPGCLLILMPLSAAMAEDARVWLAHRYTPDGEPEVRDLPKSFAARFLADELLEGLVNTLDAGYAVPFDVAVLGYSSGEDGELNLVSLLPGENPTPRLAPLAEVAVRPVEMRGREGDPRKWTASPECAGSAPATAALAEVYKFVSVWLTGRFAARPPVVIHVTDGEGIDAGYLRVARSLGLLTTAYGPTRLLHVGLAGGVEPALCGMWPESVPEPWAALREVSAELPAEAEGRPLRRAVSVNDWSVADAWSALFDLIPVEDAVAWMEADAGRFEPAVQALWTQKMGNTPEQWEDAHASDPAAGVAVVADGASTGIYCRIWADQLARRFITDRPDFRDTSAFGKWVHGLRGEWRSTIEYDKLNWSKQRKVDEVGAAATLLGLEVGPAAADGNRPWRACAVGDASLFWVRDGALLGSFPVVAADQFGSAPLLVRSNPGFKTLGVAAAGVCRPGDRFLLATDAVAARLLKSATIGPGPEWERFETLDVATWRAELDTLRKMHDMVNDDCTLVSLRVVGGEPLRMKTVQETGVGTQETIQETGDRKQETEDSGQETGGSEVELLRPDSSLSPVPGPLSPELTPEPAPDPVPESIPDDSFPIPDLTPDTRHPTPDTRHPTPEWTSENEENERKTRDGFSDSTENPV